MKKLFGIAAILLTLQAGAQNFEAPERTPESNAIENLIKRYGQPTRRYLSENDKKIFYAQPGESYIIVFVFDASETKRRALVYQLGDQGEKVKINYPSTNLAYRNGGRAGNSILIKVPEDVKAPVKYKVDGSSHSTVYIYKYHKGL